MNAPVNPPTLDHLNVSAIQAECALIGICLSDPAVIHRVMGILEPEHFQESINGTVWQAIIALSSDGRPANVVTVIARLGNPSFTDKQTLAQYLARCAADTHCPAAYATDFAKQVREFWALRQLTVFAGDIKAAAAQPGAGPREIITSFIGDLDQTRATIEGRTVTGRSLNDCAGTVLDRMNRLMTGEAVQHVVSTGLTSLDYKLGGGVKPGELIVIAGRPGMGKTTVAVSMARQMAAKGHCGALFSMEMPADQITARFITDQMFDDNAGSAVVANKILMGQMHVDDAERAIGAGLAFPDLPLEIDDSSTLTVGEIGARARSIHSRRLREGKRLEFIAVDYLKFIRASERYRGQRVLEVGEITGGLKSLAKDMGIAVILLCQLNREVEKRDDKRPQLSDLRDSGEIEQDADVVMFLYREAYYLANDPKLPSDPAIQHRLAEVEHHLEIIIAKQRMGSTGTVSVFCHPGASAVRDMGRR